MAEKYKDLEAYLSSIPEDRIGPFMKLKETIEKNIPEGFQLMLNYNMLGYVVPHSAYRDGYHCDPKLPLPFVNIANQKGFIALYHMGLYANKGLYDWFVGEYPKYSKYKLDMGKSCIRFKKADAIPFELIGQLMQKMTVEDWIDLYEKNLKG
jgi:hypothetical protein